MSTRPTNSVPPASHRRVKKLGLAMFFSGILLLAACSRTAAEKKPASPPPVPVLAAPVIQKPMPVTIDAIGTVEAFSNVQIKPQISGPMLSLHFGEGETVQKGQLLFRIDPAPFEASLQMAEANLDRSRANLLRDTALVNNAEADVRRYKDLVEKEFVTRQQYDAVTANAEALQGTVKADLAAIAADEAAVRTARLNLSYCTIVSPITGRTGKFLVYPGNQVKVNETVLLEIFQIQPIYVDFTIPEQQLSMVRTRMAEARLTVQATVPDAGTQPEAGKVSFLDNNVASGTGTIHLKAVFENKKSTLWPGQFVSVNLILATEAQAVVVPTSAVQTSQDGQYVFVVRPDQTVQSCRVTVDRTIGEESVITAGLVPGQTVVTDGQMRLVDGSRISRRESVEEGIKR